MIKRKIKKFLKEVKGKSKIPYEKTLEMYSLFNEAYGRNEKYNSCPACDVKVYNGLKKYING